jgi:hypothetical protein
MKILSLAVIAALAASSLAVPTVAEARHRDGWNNGHHNGWNNHRRSRVCTTKWRHHHRVRVCHWR